MNLLKRIFSPREIEIDSNGIAINSASILIRDSKIFELAKKSTTPEILATFGRSTSSSKGIELKRWHNPNHDNLKTERLNDNSGYINLYNSDGEEFASVMYTNHNDYDVTIICSPKELKINLDWFENVYIPSLAKRVVEYTI